MVLLFCAALSNHPLSRLQGLLYRWVTLSRQTGTAGWRYEWELGVPTHEDERHMTFSTVASQKLRPGWDFLDFQGQGS